MSDPVLRVDDKGLYCPAGSFHIDPWHPVERAVITHAHGDHARPGSSSYLCAEPGRLPLVLRVGDRVQTLAYGQQLKINNALVSLHPAGHVLGSAQVRVEVDGDVWVVSGDYKRQPDPTCDPFEIVECRVFITESTFGLPVYRWDPSEEVIQEITDWWQHNAEAGRPSILLSYVMGKTQRIMASLATLTDCHERLFAHGALQQMNEAYRASSVYLPEAPNPLEMSEGYDFSKALIEYFNSAPPRDAAWAVTYFTGKRPRSPVNAGQVRSWVQEVANIPEWLFSESYSGVGDLAETVSLLLPDPGKGSALSLSDWIEKRLLALAGETDEEVKHQTLLSWWSELDRPGRFVLTKLLTGAWRVGVSQRLVTRALAKSLSIETDVIAHRLMGAWQPDDSFYTMLSSTDTSDADISKPYPFYLAYPLDQDPQFLGDRGEWLAEWKWDGIRGQVIKRQGQVSIWSRGEELVTGRFPEIDRVAQQLADGTVVDGEILAWSTVEDSVMPFGNLQKRIGRKTVGKKLLREVPVTFMAYDLLELRGEDVRELPLEERRTLLENIIGTESAEPALRLSPLVSAESWQALDERRQQSRELHVEGFVLKHRRSTYGVGRKRGDWWKWKIEPYSVDGVLLYAQRGSGRRASLYTDYTFGIWQGDKLVPFAKAYSGLNAAEIREVDRFVRRNTVEKFGPVRSVPPELVMELHFEGIRRSTRHKSGLAVRFPRIARWRRDKSADQADSIDTIMALLPASERDK